MDNTLLFLINRQWTNAFLDQVMATFTSFDVWMPVLFILGLGCINCEDEHWMPKLHGAREDIWRWSRSGRGKSWRRNL